MEIFQLTNVIALLTRGERFTTFPGSYYNEAPISYLVICNLLLIGSFADIVLLIALKKDWKVVIKYWILVKLILILCYCIYTISWLILELLDLFHPPRFMVHLGCVSFEICFKFYCVLLINGYYENQLCHDDLDEPQRR